MKPTPLTFREVGTTVSFLWLSHLTAAYVGIVWDVMLEEEDEKIGSSHGRGWRLLCEDVTP
jgi:hypothetical protein